MVSCRPQTSQAARISPFSVQVGSRRTSCLNLCPSAGSRSSSSNAQYAQRQNSAPGSVQVGADLSSAVKACRLGSSSLMTVRSIRRASPEDMRPSAFISAYAAASSGSISSRLAARRAARQSSECTTPSPFTSPIWRLSSRSDSAGSVSRVTVCPQISQTPATKPFSVCVGAVTIRSPMRCPPSAHTDVVPSSGGTAVEASAAQARSPAPDKGVMQKNAAAQAARSKTARLIFARSMLTVPFEYKTFSAFVDDI